MESAASKLQRAFLKLLEDHRFSDITVTDVVERAGVARVSFYRNFSSTADILDRAVGQTMTELSAGLLPVLRGQDARGWRDMLFRLIYGLSDVSQLLANICPENQAIIQGCMIRHLQTFEQEQPEGTADEKYRVPARIGAVVTVVCKWLISGMAESPEEPLDCLMGFVTEI